MASATVTPSAPSPSKPAKAPGYTTLITGNTGMIGSHLFQALRGRGEGVIGSYSGPRWHWKRSPRTASWLSSMCAISSLFVACFKSAAPGEFFA
jgi:hypothetical protein